ncbi:AfsR/SARP family transcriptional regulator [Geodermatophilus sp. URMC 64]
MDGGPAQVGLLGGFRLDLAGTTVRDLPRGAQRLVAYLGLASSPARAAVAGQLWPEVPEGQAHGSLRTALWRLHRVAPDLVDSSGGALTLGRDVRVDVRETGRWARLVLDPRGGVPEQVPGDEELRCELLPGWYDDWVLLERERLRQLRLYALEALAGKLARAGRRGEAVEVAHAAIRMEPLRETAHRTLVGIHRAEGNLAEALRAYTAFREMLDREMGASPSPLMERAVAGLPLPAPGTVVALRAGRPSSGRRSAAAGVG